LIVYRSVIPGICVTLPPSDTMGNSPLLIDCS
jgi:hypothetical protein